MVTNDDRIYWGVVHHVPELLTLAPSAQLEAASPSIDEKLDSILDTFTSIQEQNASTAAPSNEPTSAGASQCLQYPQKAARFHSTCLYLTMSSHRSKEIDHHAVCREPQQVTPLSVHEPSISETGTVLRAGRVNPLATALQSDAMRSAAWGHSSRSPCPAGRLLPGSCGRCTSQPSIFCLSAWCNIFECSSSHGRWPRTSYSCLTWASYTSYRTATASRSGHAQGGHGKCEGGRYIARRSTGGRRQAALPPWSVWLLHPSQLHSKFSVSLLRRVKKPP